jgi:hypothetical protein
MPVGPGEGLGRVAVHLACRGDVESREARHPGRMVEAEAMGHPPAPVMAGETEGVVTEDAHEAGHVVRHGALGIGRMLRIGRRLARIAVASQIRADQREAVPQPQRHLVPHGKGLRIAMEQEERRARSSRRQVDHRLGHLDVADLESRKQSCRGPVAVADLALFWMHRPCPLQHRTLCAPQTYAGFGLIMPESMVQKAGAVNGCPAVAWSTAREEQR